MRKAKWYPTDDSGKTDWDYYERELEFAQMRLDRQRKLEKLQKLSDLMQKVADTSQNALGMALNDAIQNSRNSPPSNQTPS